MTEYSSMEKAALKHIAEFMAVAARTAPKTRGRDNLVILLISDYRERSSLIKKMKEIADREDRPSCGRDADNISNACCIIVIGTRVGPLGLNCGFCGYKNCAELAKTHGVCAYNSIDLGIALGSAASLAASFHVDNRLMYSIGKAAIELGLFKEDVREAVGIPLSATGKNPYFDRK